MGVYKYKILLNDGRYSFALLPNNSNTQVMGESIPYDSRQECMSALEEFQKFIIVNQIASSKSEFVSIIRDDSGFRYEIRKNGTVVFYRKEPFTKKQGLENNLAGVYKNINADLKD